MEKDPCAVYWLGSLPYLEAWQLQQKLAGEIGRGERPPTLLLLEHPHTYTFGRRGQAENLLWDEPELQRRGVSVHWVDRGGDVTYHGPGQLVGYPLLPLGALFAASTTTDAGPVPGQAARPDHVGYVRRLEEVLIQALHTLGVAAQTIPGQTGVWVAGKKWAVPAKIAAIGVKVDARGVTQHGFALNINPDMTYWQGIIACGLQDAPPASLADLLDALPEDRAILQAVIDAFINVFGYKIIYQPSDFLTAG